MISFCARKSARLLATVLLVVAVSVGCAVQPVSDRLESLDAVGEWAMPAGLGIVELAEDGTLTATEVPLYLVNFGPAPDEEDDANPEILVDARGAWGATGNRFSRSIELWIEFEITQPGEMAGKSEQYLAYLVEENEASRLAILLRPADQGRTVDLERLTG